MLKQSPQLDLIFSALADPTRRAMVERMTKGPATVSDLALPFAMTMAAVLSHLRVLEKSGLVHTRKEGRVRTCSIEPTALKTVEDWISARRFLWENRLDRIADVLGENDD
ncbi:MAG: transcriptional regulator [Glaciihabitans sp.]|nr:transcriptional regulator [Glaciihabitans sp.]